jgi:hypothetical protein
MPVLLALLSALASAVHPVFQRESSRAAPASARGWRLGGYLVRQPMWLLGQAIWVVAFGLQALALHAGRLSVVQPVLITELVFTLLIRRFATGWAVRPAAWASAGLLCVSLSLFLIAAEPQGGHPSPTASAWAWALLATGGFAAAALGLGRGGTPVRRAACYASAAAAIGALEATLIKSATETLSTRGPVAVLTTWPIYALLSLGAVSAILVQAALNAGPLTVSQPLLVVLNPLTSIALSVWLFGEHFTGRPGAILLGGCAFLGLVAGVVLLTVTGPRADEVTVRPASPPPSGSARARASPRAASGRGPRRG